jgi:hypothetical protein
MALNSGTNNKRGAVSNTLLNGVKTIVNRKSGPWTGTMTELNIALANTLRSSLPQNWPSSPSALRVALNRVIRRVRGEGISVRFTRTSDRSRTRLVQLSIR